MRTLLHQLWLDEAGYLLSAEAVTVGTLGVAGATAGIGALSKSVNEELTETAYAIRSLDQSFVIPEQRSAGAWTAGSAFAQRNVDESHAELGQFVELHGGRSLARSPRLQDDRPLSQIAPSAQAMLPRDLSALSPAEREDLRRIRQRVQQKQRAAEDEEAAASTVPK